MKKNTYYFLVFIFIKLLICNSLKGNNIPHYFNNYNTNNGLSNNSIFCSLQDSYGFIWFGTRDGLNRFDGHNFDIFRMSKTEDVGLSSNHILTLAEDKNKNLWVGTDNGIYYSDYLKNRFHSLSPLFEFQEIYNINIDKNNVVWFLSSGELYSYDTKNKLIVKRSSNKLFTLTTSGKDDMGNLYYGSNRGMLFKLINNNLSLIANLPKHIKTIHSINIQAISPVSENEIILGTTKHGVLKWDNLKNEASTFFLDKNSNSELFVRDILLQNDQIYWYGTENGLYIHDVSNNTYTHYKKKIYDKWSLSDNAVYNLLQDNEGGIWIGTYFSGAHYYHQNNNHIKKIYPNGDHNNIQGNVVRAINQDKSNNIWIGTEDGGFTKWNPNKNLFYNYSTKSNTIANDNVHGLLCIDNHVWVSTFFNGLDIFDTKLNTTEKHIDRDPDLKNGLLSNFINFLYQSKNGKIYATTRGVYVYDPKIKNFILETNLPKNIIYQSIYEDDDNNLWFGTYRNGVYVYNTKNHSSKQFLKEHKTNNNLPHNRVNYIFQDSNKTMWIATDEGIAYLNKENDDFIKISTDHIKFGNIITGIIEDNNKNLWISSTNGLLRYNIETKAKRVFNIESGLISMQFNYNSVFKDRHDKLYFGSNEGLIYFNPKYINDIKFPDHIPLYITNFQLQDAEIKNSIDNKRRNSTAIPFTDKIDLKYNESSFIISFAALLFQSPKSITYQYIMEGLDNKWTTILDNRKVYFTKLSPGTYTFKLKAIDPNGNILPEMKLLSINITHPWWSSPYAIFLYILLLCSGFIVLNNFYLRRSKKHKEQVLLKIQQQKDHELIQSKMIFFTAVAHEIRTPLTLIKGPLEKLRSTLNTSPKEDKLLATMHRNTEKLINISNQILDFRKTEIASYRFEFSNQDVEIILSKIYLDFISTFKNLKKDVHYHAEKNIMANIDVEAFEVICNNLLSNALKYSDKSIEVTLKSNQEDLTFSIQVKNDGELIDNNDVPHIFDAFKRARNHKYVDGSGLGLTLSKNIVEKHNGSISYKVDDNNMNCFEITLPQSTI